MTDQLRIAFRRSFCKQDLKDPEESLVDVIAGHFEYWPAFFTQRMSGRISFRKIQEIERIFVLKPARLFDLGVGSSLANAERTGRSDSRYKKKDKDLQDQGAMPFRDVPKKDLRVTSVLVNDPARLSGMRLHRNGECRVNPLCTEPLKAMARRPKSKIRTGGRLAQEIGCLTSKYPSRLGKSWRRIPGALVTPENL